MLVAVTLDRPADTREPDARLDDTTRVPAGLVPVSFEPAPITRDWLVHAPVPVPRTDRAVAGTWLLRLDLPRAAAGQGVWINGERWPLRWLPDPVREAAAAGLDLDADDPALNPFASPNARAVRTRADLRAFAEPAARSPLSRWKFRLMTRGLTPGAVQGPPMRVTPEARDLARRVADDTESRWRRALLSLYFADVELSITVRRALAGAVLFETAGGTAAVPIVWPEAGLLRDLLTATSPRQTRERAEAWLATVPSVSVRIIDDAVAIHGDGSIDVRVRTVATRPGLLSLGPSVTRGTGELFDLDPARALNAVVGVSPRDSGVVALVSGEESLATRVAPIPARPPALAMWPLVAESTLAEWRGDAAAVIDPSARVVLQRQPGPDGRFQVYVEVAEPTGTDQPGSTVRLAVGDRTIVLSAGRAAVRTPALWADVVELDLSPRAGSKAEPGAALGTVAIGVVRTRSNGSRSSWPRPQMPWDTEMPRAPVDLGAWTTAGG